MSPQALVIGANRGIGLHFVKVLIEKGWKVSGTIRPQTRSDPSFEDLQRTGARIIDLDYLDDGSIIKAAETYGDGPLDVLVNCAGVDVHPRAWEENTAEIMIEKFRIMTVGPFLATKAFFSSLRKSNNARVINISSDYASISDNHKGRCISYRIAKSALNQQTVSIANELKTAGDKVTMLALDPDDIPTRLSRGNGNTDIDQSVRGMVKIIEETTLEMTGSFPKWNGEKLAF